MLEKQLDTDLLYNRIVHYYIDKKGKTKEDANRIAQAIVKRESQRMTCKNEKCGHMAHDHLRNSHVCLRKECKCTGFTG